MERNCPEPEDVTDLQFKLQCRLKVFEHQEISTFPNTVSLLACASRYGLLFVGSNLNSFQAIQTIVPQNYTPKDKDVSNYARRTIELPSKPTHLSVNCDCNILAVIFEGDKDSMAIFYDVLSLLTSTIKVISEIGLGVPRNVYVREVNWNPSIPNMFTVCKSDGSLRVFELEQGNARFYELPPAAGATCFCWSPKGKQIAVGSKDGKITQYKPDLKAVKVISEPKLTSPHSIINLQWVSNYQFIGVYQSVQDNTCLIVVVDAPKNSFISCINYEDICYSGDIRTPQFYLILLQTWNFLMVASANSTEVGVMGNNKDLWTQWMMSDNGRAELPLSADHQETFPVGVTLDISSTSPLPWGESSIPPCPLLCVLSHQGVLCCFNVVYLKEGVPSVCTPPDPISHNVLESNIFVVEQRKQNAPSVQPKLETIANEPQIAAVPTLPSTIPNQSTPLVTGKRPTSDIGSSKTLFGGQVTLTPIKPQEPSSMLFGGQTLLTPINKVSTAAPAATTTATTTNFNEKYASIFSSVNPTTLPQQSATVPVKPIVISASLAKPEPDVKVEEAVVTVESKPKDTDNTAAASQETLLQMIQEDWMYLEMELRHLVQLGRNIKVTVGTEIEKLEMVEQISRLQEFVKEAAEISVGQSSEIHCLKQNLIQSWAWYEEAKSHYNSSKNETVALLIKMQPLDSLSQKRLKDIEQLISYVDSQVSQVNRTLDEQWDNFQRFAKKLHCVKMPTMETIFQTMVRQNAILQRQTYVLKDISIRLRTNNSNTYFPVVKRDLADDFQSLRLDSRNILQLQYEKIKNYSKNMSDVKAKKLRALINQREVTCVKAVKPQVSSWAINQSPASIMKMSASHRPKLTPGSKQTIARNLDFSQQPFISKQEVAKTTTLASTSNTASLQSTFTPLVKSGPVISSSQGSAFTPIVTPALSVSEKQQDLQKMNKPVITSSLTFGLATTQNKLGFGSGSTQASILNSNPTPSTVSSTASVTNLPLFGLGGNKNVPVVSEITNFLAAATTTTSNVLPIKPQVFGSSAPSSLFTYLPPVSVTSQLGAEVDLKLTNTPPILTNLPSVADKVTGSQPPATTTSQSLFANAITKPLLFGPTGTSLYPKIGPIPDAPITKSVYEKSAKLTVSLEAEAIAYDINQSSKAAEADSVIQSSPPSNVITVSLFGTNNLSTGVPATSSTTGGKLLPQNASITFKNQLPASQAAQNVEQPPKTISTATISDAGKPLNFVSPSASIFGSPKTTVDPALLSSVSSIFRSPQTTTISSTQDNAIQSSIFGSSQKTVASTMPSAEKTSIFASSATVASTIASVEKPSIFGSPSATVASIMPFVEKPSIFGSPSATVASIMPSVEKPSIFGSPSVTVAPTISSVKKTSIFGSPSVAPVVPVLSIPAQSSNSANSSSAEVSDANASLFSPSTFVTPVNSVSSTSNGSIETPKLFGTSLITTPTTTVTLATPTQSIFGVTATTTGNFGASASTGSIFGSASTATSFATPKSGSSIFGTPVSLSTAAPTPTTIEPFNVTTDKPSAFGSSSAGNLFAAAAATAPTGNIFGSIPSSMATAATPTVTTGGTGNVFAANAASIASQPSSLFGAPASTSGTSIFGQTTTTFGNQASFGTTTAPSVFGQNAIGFASSPIAGSTTTTSGSIFGSATPAVGGFGPDFSTSTTTNTFGTPSLTQQTSSGTFGFGSLAVGGSGGVSSSGSIFGGGSSTDPSFGQTTPPNPFGKSEAKSAFGTSGSSIFGNTPSNSASTNIFGAPPAFGATSSSFGSPSSFGASSAFGQKPAFGLSPGFGGAASTFGSAAASPVAQTGFGSPASFQKPAAFAGGSIFGSPAAFGGTPNFGGSPSFGATATFGSPEKVFGANQPASGGFAAAAQQNAGFGNIASQNTIGFGNLAQQANTPTTMPFSGNSSFSSWR